jgi:hypothetical protein
VAGVFYPPIGLASFRPGGRLNRYRWVDQSPQEPKSAPAARVSKRQWAKIVKKPESYKGDKYILYGQVTQFDSATGDDSFLADTAHRNTMSYDFFDGENTLLTGDAKQLDDLVEDDVFRDSVTVLGKLTTTPRSAATPQCRCLRSTASR